MAEMPRTTVQMTDFPGMIANMDPRDLPPGAAEDQVNVCCILVGELQVRLGLREPNFEN